MPEPQGARIPASRVHPPHATKAMSNQQMIPDGLLVVRGGATRIFLGRERAEPGRAYLVRGPARCRPDPMPLGRERAEPGRAYLVRGPARCRPDPMPLGRERAEPGRAYLVRGPARCRPDPMPGRG